MNRIYLSAHEESPAHATLNRRVADLLRDYAFSVFIPPSESVSADLMTPIDFSGLMIVIFHKASPTPRMDFEMAEAVTRHLPMIAITTIPVQELPDSVVAQFVKIIPAPNDHDDLLHPLMTALNRHFPG